MRDRHIYVGLTRLDLCDIREFVGHLQNNLKDLILEREQSIKEFKSNIFINAEDFQKYGSSDYVKDIIELLNKVDKDGEEAHISLKDAIDVRDHLILTLTFITTLRASNIINITLNEVQAAKKHDEFEAFVFKNNKYKTSLIYREKITLVPALTYHHIKLYLKYLRPLILLDSHRALRDRYLFVASKTGPQTKALQMSHPLITNLLSKCFENGGVFSSKPEAYKKVSCSRIRFSIITELVALGEDNLDSIAHCHGKHNMEVCKKHYVQFYSNKTATELSWKAYERCKTLTKEEQKAVNKRAELLSKKKLPAIRDIQTWYKELRNYHKVHANVDVTDKGLENILEGFIRERAVRDDG